MAGAKAGLGTCLGKTSLPTRREPGVKLMPYTTTKPVNVVIQIAPEEAYQCTILPPAEGGGYALDRLLRRTVFAGGDFHQMEAGPATSAMPQSPKPAPSPPTPPARTAAPDKNNADRPTQPSQPPAATPAKAPAPYREPEAMPPKAQKRKPAKQKAKKKAKSSKPTAKAKKPEAAKQLVRPDGYYRKAMRKQRLATAEVELIDALEGRIAAIDEKVKERIAALQAQADREIDVLRLEQEQAMTHLKELMKA